MKDIMERFLVLPISMGCMSKSTTDGKRSPGVKIKDSWGVVSRTNISRGMRRIILEAFQRFSQLLNYRNVEEIEMEIELEIGYPTDVKHVTHIGYDGSMTTNPVKNWENIETPELHSFPAISLKQFEHAMAAQSEIPPPVLNSSKNN
ncbi:hypothetical protein R6Q57_010818 [Mikania cordata]